MTKPTFITPRALKSCPFCGQGPETLSRPDSLDGFYAAVSCRCGGYSATAHQGASADTQEEAERLATEKWNTRA